MILLIGVVAAVASIVVIVATVAHLVGESRIIVVPGSLTETLTPGDYFVYEVSGDAGGLIQPADVTITGPDGQVLPVGQVRAGTPRTVPRDGAIYAGTVEFVVPSRAVYEVVIRGPVTGRAFVAPSLSELVRPVAAWSAVALAGALLFIVGLAMLITGGVRRRRGHKVAAVGGWIPAPGLPAQGTPWYQGAPAYPGQPGPATPPPPGDGYPSPPPPAPPPPPAGGGYPSPPPPAPPPPPPPPPPTPGPPQG